MLGGAPSVNLTLLNLYCAQTVRLIKVLGDFANLSLISGALVLHVWHRMQVVGWEGVIGSIVMLGGALPLLLIYVAKNTPLHCIHGLFGACRWSAGRV
jgi:hypothetical protein